MNGCGDKCEMKLINDSPPESVSNMNMAVGGINGAVDSLISMQGNYGGRPSPSTDDLEKRVQEKALNEFDNETQRMVPQKHDMVEEEEDPLEGRVTWDNKIQYILAVVSFAVGLGNIWRFPYLAQKNGGGAFLIPYTVMLVIEGIPLFFLELSVGQRLRKGPLGAWAEVHPLLGGIGVASVLVSFLTGIYYNTVVTWCLFYLFNSFQSPLPWSYCPKIFNDTLKMEVEIPECVRASPTEYFWYRSTLNISDSLAENSYINWRIALCLFAAWLIVFLSMIKGIKSSGKVVYVTATFPYVVLTIFFFRAVTLPGFSAGVIHMFTPDWSKLEDPKVWLDAATQIFFSLSLAFGGLIAMSSYMPVDNNTQRDAICVTICNCLTSIYAGIVVFSILGFKAHMNYEKCLEDVNRTITEYYAVDTSTAPATVDGMVKIAYNEGLMSTMPGPVVKNCSMEHFLSESVQGTGLAFIAFTEAINQFGWTAPLWSVLFFLMLLALGMGSMFGTLQGVLTSLTDMKMFGNIRKEFVSGALCLVSYIVALCFAHSSGEYILQIFDSYAATLPLLIIAFFEVIAISWVYGLKQFSDDIELMCGFRPNAYWLFCWKYISPLMMLIIFTASVVIIAVDGPTYTVWDPSVGETSTGYLVWWARILAALLTLSSTIWIPVIAVVRYFNLTSHKEEIPAFFPEEKLRRKHNLQPHEVTSVERCLFRF